MKIAAAYLRDYRILVQLDESDVFQVPFSVNYKTPENGRPLEVRGLQFDIDLETGEVTAQANGYLVNRDGRVGERRRDQYLEAEQIPPAALEIIVIEAAEVRDRINNRAPLKIGS